MKLSDHFNLEEFTFSEAASRQGMKVEPTDAQLANCQRLCTSVLEIVRVRLDRVMFILSGIRPAWLNDLIGGASNSAHMHGRAADTRVQGMGPKEFFGWLMEQKDLPFDQVIEEYDSWVHIAIAEESTTPRRQFLRATKVAGKTKYEVVNGG